METLGHIRLFLLALLSVICFSACTGAPGSLYAWGNYENKVYAYLQNESPAEQIDVLQNDLIKIEETGRKAPPGYYAHLGMLYAEVGEHGLAISCFMAEKARFPEAAVFMDYLLERYKL
jgi:hypothetical protein